MIDTATTTATRFGITSEVKVEVRTRTFVRGTAVDSTGLEFTWHTYKEDGRGGRWNSSIRPVALIWLPDRGVYVDAKAQEVRVETGSLMALFDAIDKVVETPRA